jgi:hypothetical protein
MQGSCVLEGSSDGLGDGGAEGDVALGLVELNAKLERLEDQSLDLGGRIA